MQFHIDKDYIVRIRRELHKVPELSFDLPETLKIIRRELDALGIPYTEELGKSSIVATLNEGVGNKTIGIRADTDALPIEEVRESDFKSTHPGKMHACGHDAHTAMLLGTAKALKKMEKDIHCCVKFIFQASEEGVSGANLLCEDGVMDDIDFITACHVVPHMKVGTIQLNKTCSNASSRGFRIKLTGRSCHVSKPQDGVDAIAMATRVYTGIQMMRAREIDPFESLIVNIGEFHAGTANNIVPGYAEMTGTTRSLKNEIDAYVYKRVQEIAESTAKEIGGSAEVETYKFSPCLINDHGVVDMIVEAAEKVIGAENINIHKPISMGAEDFAYYTLKKPGAQFGIGICPEDGKYAPLHNGNFILNEDGMTTAPAIWVQIVLDQMDK
jgi:amidohydrolase